LGRQRSIEVQVPAGSRERNGGKLTQKGEDFAEKPLCFKREAQKGKSTKENALGKDDGGKNEGRAS